MPLSIHDIIEIASLRTRLLEGEAGLARQVRWAHVCELADPTEWLGEGDLLMTTGIGIPADPRLQRGYVERLAQAKVSGLMIGENMQAPADLGGLREAAGRLGFPLLMTHYAVPFSAVTRAVLDAGRQEEFERRNAIGRLYESARLGLRGIGVGALLERLAKDVRSHLYLFDAQGLEPWLPGLEPLPQAWRESLLARRQELRGAMPAITRCTRADSDSEALVMALPSQPSCELLACGGELLDYGLLYHLAGVLGMELERLQAEQERQLRLGSELIDDLLDQRLAERAARERLGQMQCPVERCALALANIPVTLPGDWHQRLRREGLDFLARNQGQELMVLLADPAAAQRLQAVLGCPVGLSNALGHPARAPEAVREARLALAHASMERPLVAYASAQAEQPWLPASLDEAARIHRGVLGLLADYDRVQNSRLQQTLRVFLEQNRSWQKAAHALNVHKQTLVYRIRRIEEITGRSLDSTEDVAVLWIALRAGDMAGESA